MGGGGRGLGEQSQMVINACEILNNGGRGEVSQRRADRDRTEHDRTGLSGGDEAEQEGGGSENIKDGDDIRLVVNIWLERGAAERSSRFGLRVRVSMMRRMRHAFNAQRINLGGGHFQKCGAARGGVEVVVFGEVHGGSIAQADEGFGIEVERGGNGGGTGTAAKRKLTVCVGKGKKARR